MLQSTPSHQVSIDLDITNQCTAHTIQGSNVAANNRYLSWISTLECLLSQLDIHCRNGFALMADQGFDILLQLTLKARADGKRIFLIGNGASATMASHIAADLCKGVGVKAQVFTDPALLTALCNDYGSEHIFCDPLEIMSEADDLLIAISSSGASPNILRAVKAARLRRLHVITFSAMAADNPLRYCGELNFYVPAKSYGFAECAHTALLHYWVDTILVAVAMQKIETIQGTELRADTGIQ